MPHPFHSDGHEKWERGRLPGSKSESGPRLSLGNGAISVPKAPSFTVDFLAGSRRLRARAPGLRESSIGLADPGPPKAGAKVDGKTRHFSHFGRQFLDRVGFPSGKTPNGTRGHAEPQPVSYTHLTLPTILLV